MGDCGIDGADCPTVPSNCQNMKGQDCSAGLSPGDTVSIQDLLYGLLLDSGNDAAIALAEVVAGTELDFVELMNQRADLLGLSNTSFANSHGRDPQKIDKKNCPEVDFDDPKCAHYSTARDLAYLARTALPHPLFATVVSTPTYDTQNWSAQNSTNVDASLDTSNSLIRNSRGNVNFYPGTVGVKTGTTDLAGECLVAAANGQISSSDSAIAVVLGAMEGDRYRDAKTVLDFGLNYIRADEAEFVSQQVPGSVIIGDQQTASITMLNAGSNAWHGGYVLRSLATGWLTDRVSMKRSVPPGETITLSIPLKTLVTGDYSFQWRVFTNFTGYFGEATPRKTVRVLDRGDGSEECAALNQSLAQAEARLRDWQEMLRTAPPSHKAEIKRQIDRVKGEISAIKSKKQRLGCP